MEKLALILVRFYGFSPIISFLTHLHILYGLINQYLAGFTAFRRSPAALIFLADLSAFIVKNLIAGRARAYLDQIGLFASVYRHESLLDAITQLPIQKFCDTLLKDEALVWSVTQRKDDERYNAYKQTVLARFERERHSYDAGGGM